MGSCCSANTVENKPHSRQSNEHFGNNGFTAPNGDRPGNDNGKDVAPYVGQPNDALFPSSSSIARTDSEKMRDRELRAEAAEKRMKDFKQGGGGERLKRKAAEREKYEKRNRELGGGPGMQWRME